jgi:hypothetical protein
MTPRHTGLLAAISCLLATAASAQLSVVVQDISPDTSNNADADAASGGRVNGLGVDRSTPARVYAASEFGGLFASADNGLTWRHLDGHVPTVTWDVEVDPTNSNRLYATSFFDGRSASRSGINVSTDAGATWTHPPTATPPANFCATNTRRSELAAFGISIDPANSNRVLIGTNCGLAISTDAGGTWAFVDPTPGDLADDVRDVVVHDGGIIDVCGDDGHLRSTDGGANWTTAATQPLQTGRCSLAVSPDEPYVLFAAVGTSIFESDDGGQSWPVTYANPTPQGRIPFLATNQRQGATFDLWFGDVSLFRGLCTTPSPAAAGGAQRCAASAGWAGPFTRSNGAHDDSGDIAFVTGVANDACPRFFSSDGGVYRNTLTASPGCHTPAWAQPTVTPHALWNFTFAGVSRPGVATEHLYFGNQDTGTFGALNGGSTPVTWNTERCCDGFDATGDATRGLSTVCCFSPGRATRLFVSSPGLTGASPEIGTYPPGNMRSFEQLEAILTFSPNQYVIATTSGVFLTTNIGASPIVWTQLGAGTSPASPCGLQVAMAGGTPTFFVKSGGCNGDTAGTLWRHQGTGAAGTWQQVPTPGVGSFGVYAVDPNDRQRLIASHLGGPAGPRMVLTRNGGTTWTPLAALDLLMTGAGTFLYQNVSGPGSFASFNGYPQPTLVAIDPSDPDILVAGAADAGVFISTNGGTRWQLVTDPNTPGISGTPHIPRPYYAHFDHDPPAGDINLFLGTRGRGAWRLTFKKVLMSEIQVPSPPSISASCVGAKKTGTLNVCNTSGADLVVAAITSSNPAFAITTPSGGFPVTISHDFCFPFELALTPSGPGAQTTDLTIFSNDPNFPALHVAASGDGTTPSIRVTGSTDFGVASAWKPAEKTVSVCNTGACNLEVTSVSIGCPDFSLVNSPFPATVSPDSCLDTVIEFTPTLPGLRTCTLTVTSNDPTNPTITRTLTGRTPPWISVNGGLANPHGAFSNFARKGSTFNLDFVNAFQPKLAWDLRLGFSRFDGRSGNPDTELWTLSPNFRFTFNPAGWLRVFVNGGFGLYHFDPGTFEAGANLGLGLNLPLGRRFGLELTYNYNWAFTGSPVLQYDQLQLGLVISF